MVLVKDKENVVYYTLKEKVIKYLIENKEKVHSIRGISNFLGVDYKNTFNAVNSLRGLILKEKKGNINLLKLNFMISELIYIVEEKRKKEFLLKHKEFRLILEDINSLSYPFLIALVFGSYAKGKENSKSDVDICLISDNNEKTKKLITRLKLLPMNLEIHNFSAEEFESMLKTKENNLSDEIIKNNVVLYGVESYYNLVSKWMKKE